MFYTKILDDEGSYEKLILDGKVFYRKMLKPSEESDEKKNIFCRRKKRYSDQFKDPVFIKKETIRKLKMIKSFKEKNGDLEYIIDSWKMCISECINILDKEYNINPIEIFKTFNLRKYGFSYEDFGIDINEDFN